MIHPLRQSLALAILIAAAYSTATAQPIAPCDPHLDGFGIPGTSGYVGAMLPWDPDGPGPQHELIIFSANSTVAGNVQTNNMGLYDPTTDTFAPLWGAGETVHPIHVSCLAMLPNGDLVAGRSLFTIPGTQHIFIQRWNGTEWLPLGGGVNGSVNTLVVLPNGDLIAGGEFTHAGGVQVNHIARWDGTTWSPLGSGMTATGVTRVAAILALPNGDLVAAGSFTTAGGVAASRVARWDGTSWSPLGSGLNGGPRTIARLPNGDILVGGTMTTNGDGTTINHIARWDGKTWSPLGEGLAGTGSNWIVQSITVLANGDAVAAGSFTTAGGQPANAVARWNGNNWSPFGSGINQETTFQVAPYAACTAPLSNGDFLIGGVFLAVGDTQAQFIARWRGTEWSHLGRSLNQGIKAIAHTADGQTIVAGDFTMAAGTRVNHIATWNGATWTPLGNGVNGTVNAVISLPNADIIAGGLFSTAGQAAANSIARWDGTQWHPLGSGIEGEVRAIARMPNADLIVGGRFSIAGELPTSNLARWNGTAWSTFGPGITSDGPDATVNALKVLDNGDLLVAGDFTSAAGTHATDIARFNGKTWSSMGLETTAGSVNALAILNNGDIIAGGDFVFGTELADRCLARWDGASWRSIGRVTPVLSTTRINALTLLPDGDLIIAGVFNGIDSVFAQSVARWNGASWSSLGFTGRAIFSNEFGINALATLQAGSLAIGGDFHDTGSTPTSYLDVYHFDGIPSVIEHPQPRSVRTGKTLTLTATPAPGFVGVRVKWYRNSIELADESEIGGDVTGASHPLESPTSGIPATLTIRRVVANDAGRYHAVFTNTCGTVSTTEARITLRPACPSDINGDDRIDTHDLVKLLSRFGFTAPPGSDAESADVFPDGVINTLDVTLFILDFGTNCS